MKTLVAVAIAVSAFAAPAAEAALDLNAIRTFPDLTALGVQLSHDTSTDTLDAVTAGVNFLQLDSDGVSGTDADAIGVFDLTATINNAGVLSGGSLTITQNGAGVVTPIDAGPYPVTLLTATLTQFDFTTAADTDLEFLATVTGGSQAALFGGNGASIGILLNPDGLDLPDVSPFGSDIATRDVAANVFAVIPTPATAALLGPLAALALLRRRTR